MPPGQAVAEGLRVREEMRQVRLAAAPPAAQQERAAEAAEAAEVVLAAQAALAALAARALGPRVGCATSSGPLPQTIPS